MSAEAATESTSSTASFSTESSALGSSGLNFSIESSFGSVYSIDSSDHFDGGSFQQGSIDFGAVADATPTAAEIFDVAVDYTVNEPASIEFQLPNLDEPPQYATNFSPDYYLSSQQPQLFDLTPSSIGNERFASSLDIFPLPEVGIEESVDRVITNSEVQLEETPFLEAAEVAEVTEGLAIVNEVLAQQPQSEGQLAQRFDVANLTDLSGGERQELRQIARAKQTLMAIGTLPQVRVQAFIAPGIDRFVSQREQTLLSRKLQPETQPQTQEKIFVSEEIEVVTETMERQLVEKEVVEERVEREVKEVENKERHLEVIEPRVDLEVLEVRRKAIGEVINQHLKAGKATITGVTLASVIRQIRSQFSGLAIKLQKNFEGTIEYSRQDLAVFEEIPIQEAVRKSDRVLLDHVPVTDKGNGVRVGREQVEEVLSKPEALEITEVRVEERKTVRVYEQVLVRAIKKEQVIKEVIEENPVTTSS
jgi:hypothetical protein